MIKRTIEISREAARLSAQNAQLCVEQVNPLGEKNVRTIPCEDIGVVMVDHPATTYTQGALVALLDAGAVLAVCGKDHLPLGLLLPLSNHTQVQWRVDDQVEISQPLRKRLWQQIISAKIRAQADTLDPAQPLAQGLREIAAQVRSGDPDNSEALAARYYWSAWLGGGQLASSLTAQSGWVDLSGVEFVRDQDGRDGINLMLNYGYAILRAAVARVIVAAGLLPHLGIHHRHRANHFALADDLMEPLRPLVDRRVRHLHAHGQPDLDQSAKAELLRVLSDTVTLGEQRGPLLVALHRYVASYAQSLEKKSAELLIPVLSDGT